MRDTSIRRLRDAAQAEDQPDNSHHDYHSAVEIDESEANWKDWVGPGLAVFGVLAAVLLLFLTNAGHI